MCRATRSVLPVLLLIVLCGAAVHAQERTRPAPAAKPAPTESDVPYGDHANQVIDFYKAVSDTPTPFVLFIHGGGFRNGSKSSVNANTLRALLDAGISVFGVEYRFIGHAPLPAAHEDCTRALQFIRSKAAEWNLDKTRAGAFGGSAGAQISMYLAFKDDMAAPESDDPIARESTRLTCVAQSGGQITMDLAWWIENIPGYERPHREPGESFRTTDESVIRPIVQDISVVNHLTADDPPVYSSYGMAPEEAIPEDSAKASGWKIHHVTFGVKLKEKLDALGIENHLRYPGATPEYATDADFFKAQLLGD